MVEDDCDKNRLEDEGEVARENEVEKKWKKIKATYCETAKDVLGYRTKKNKNNSWISPESWKGVEERKQLMKKLAGTRSERLKARLQQEYRKNDLEVKKSLRKDKREWANSIAQEAEDAAKCEQKKDVYDATRRLCSGRQRKLTW